MSIAMKNLNNKAPMEGSHSAVLLLAMGELNLWKFLGIEDYNFLSSKDDNGGLVPLKLHRVLLWCSFPSTRNFCKSPPSPGGTVLKKRSPRPGSGRRLCENSPQPLSLISMLPGYRRKMTELPFPRWARNEDD